MEDLRMPKEQFSKLSKVGLKLAIEKIRAKAKESSLTEEDVMNEVRAVRRSRGLIR